MITKEKAALWTDGRYWQQAEKELSEEWDLMKQGHKDCPSISNWLSNLLGEKYKLGIDPKLVTFSFVSPFEGHLVYIDENLVDQVWENKPLESKNKIIVLDVQFTGKSVQQKLDDVRVEMQKLKVDSFVVTTL